MNPGDKVTIKACKGPGDPGGLCGLREAAAILGVDPPGVSRWRATGKMPTLLGDLRSGPVWRREDVEAMAAERAEAAADRAAAPAAAPA